MRRSYSSGLRSLKNPNAARCFFAAARALGLPTSSTRFGHGAEHRAPDGRVLLSSYHCSRYNQNTRRLDAAMFESVFARALELRQ